MPNHSSKPDRPRDINQLAKFLVDKSTGQIPPDAALDEPTPDPETPVDPLRAAAAELGRRGGLKGGKARAAKMTPEQRTEVAKKAAAARWAKRRAGHVLE
jgi:hypothetical protein